MTVIEVASIRPSTEPRRPGHVIAANGAAFECWPEKLGKLQVGHRYAVEVETREWQGRPIRKIVKAEPANAADVQALPTNTTRVPHSRNGETVHAPSPRRGEGQKDSRATPVNQEQAFVATVLGAFIVAGRVGPDARELEQATTLVRSLWRVTFGGGGTHG